MRGAAPSVSSLRMQTGDLLLLFAARARIAVAVGEGPQGVDEWLFQRENGIEFLGTRELQVAAKSLGQQ